MLPEETLVLKDHPLLVAANKLGDSSVVLAVRAWVKSPDYWPAYFKLQEDIKLTLDQNDIPIPFPQMDLHIYETSGK